jgi:hypothetical protein
LSYKAGTASVLITPDEPLWLAGYAARGAPARGKISDLFASALALEDAAGGRFVLASLDVIAIAPAIAEPVAEAVRSRHGLSREQLLLAPTHTHYGPEFRTDKAVFFNIPAEYAAKLATTAQKLAAAVTQAIDRAFERLEPVRLFVRKTSMGFAHNRRRHGVVAGTPSAEDVVDHEAPVLDCVDAAGKRKAIVFGYACHTTTIPPADQRYCADWCGFAREQLEQANPGATAFFLPGAGADQDPEPSGSVELSRRHGREMADAVQRVLQSSGVEIDGPIRAALDFVPLVVQTVTPAGINAMLASGDRPQQVKGKFLSEQLSRGEPFIESYQAPLQVVRFGNELLLIALSGEPVVDWSHKFKDEFSRLRFHGTAPLAWIAGYCNDMFGYVPTRRIQAEGGYEGGRASLWSWLPGPFADDLEDRILSAVRKLVEQVGD